jgi:quinolinate synthase
VQPGTPEHITSDTPVEPGWSEEVRRLAADQDAVVLAHNYQRPQIQDVADHVGDSLALSRLAKDVRARTIVFCGVHFMAETAKILSPDKTVLIPDPDAGCSLADQITADQLREWKGEHPGAVVVAYVNTTAEVKAESDLCCTSSNAVDVVASIPPEREVLFLPDVYLGSYVRRRLGRENMHVWHGECHVHAGISSQALTEATERHPRADLFIHPECGCTTSAMYRADEGAVAGDRVKVLSTGGMLGAARATTADTVLVATEIGMLHQLHRTAPQVEFIAVDPEASCQYMKMTTPQTLLDALRNRRTAVEVPVGVADRARSALEGMIAIGSPGPGE